MIIDAHAHVLPGGLPPGHLRFRREMSGTVSPSGTETSEAEMDDLVRVSHPERIIELQEALGIDRTVVLSVAPSDYTRYGKRGTVDLGQVTDVGGEPTIDKANDYIAALTRMYPGRLIGMASVNPRYRGPDAAVRELRRSVQDLGLSGLKLYPMYDRWALDDEQHAVPVFDAAQELGVPVMVHMGNTPVADTVLSYGHPLPMDEIAKRFPELRLLICHAAFPWTAEALAVASRHEHVYMDLSYFNSVVSGRQLHDFLVQAKRMGVPLNRICWGTDHPAFEDPRQLLAVTADLGRLVVSDDGIEEAEIAYLLGGSMAGFLDLEWDLTETLTEIDQRRATWTEATG